MSCDIQSVWKLKKYGRRTEKGWHTVHDGSGAINLVLQPQMNLLVLQNAVVLESVPLLINPGTVRGAVQGDVLMIITSIDNKKQSKRFRVLFARENDTDKSQQPLWDCVDALRIYFPISTAAAPKDSAASIQTTTLAEILQNILTFKDDSAGQNVEIFTSSPVSGSSLDDMVRLCLLDPTFPAFVGSVEKSLKSLTNPDQP